MSCPLNKRNSPCKFEATIDCGKNPCTREMTSVEVVKTKKIPKSREKAYWS